MHARSSSLSCTRSLVCIAGLKGNINSTSIARFLERVKFDQNEKREWTTTESVVSLQEMITSALVATN